MKEYIDREAALALTHEINIPKIGYRHRCIDPGAIKELPAAAVAPVTGWIPVSERLPEEYTRVIGFMAWKAMTAIEYQNGKWYSIDHLSPLPDEAVTHWMPLPEPPKEVSE